MFNTIPFIRNTQLKLLLTTAILILLNGCAHQNYLDEGLKYAQTNQYEAAVEQFTLALNEQPNDIETQTALTNATKKLYDWAQALEPKADSALENGQLGKAFLLYGKSAQITKNPYSIKHYKDLYSTLREKSLIHAQISPNKLDISNMDLAKIEGIKASDTPNVLLALSQSNPIFETQQSTQDAVVEYVSGSQLIANPELVSLQHHLQEKRTKQHYNQGQLSKLRSAYNDANSKIQNLSSKIQRVEMQQRATNLSNEQQANYKQQASSLRSQLSSAKSKKESDKKKLDYLKKSSTNLRNQINNISNALAFTPAVVEVPVYSEHVYQEFKQTNILSGVVYLRVNNIMRTASVSVSSSDVSHPAQPTINLGPNPMDVLSKEQLTPNYQTERFNIGLRLINELVAEHKASFLYKAQDSTNLDQKLTLLVQHSLVTSDGGSEPALTMISNMLTTEFGRGAIFNINQLLDLY